MTAASPALLSAMLFPRGARLTANSRLWVALILAAGLHAALIAGITINDSIDKPVFRAPPRLEIVLLPARAQEVEAPKQADYLAQASQLGSGNTRENVPAPVPVPSPVTPPPAPEPAPPIEIVPEPAPPAMQMAQPLPDPAPVIEPLPEPLPEPVPVIERVVEPIPEPLPEPASEITPEPLPKPVKPVLTAEPRKPVKPKREIKAHIEPDPEVPPPTPAAPEKQISSKSADAETPRRPAAAVPSGAELISRGLEIASLEAQIAESSHAYSERPRQKTISASTQEFKYASYMEAWRAKVERIGNLNYPEEARRRKLTGSLVLDVALNANGSINSISLRKSSGQKILDDAAIRIVRLAAPYGPFPPDIKKDIDILHITRTWQFTTGNRLSSR